MQDPPQALSEFRHTPPDGTRGADPFPSQIR